MKIIYWKSIGYIYFRKRLNTFNDTPSRGVKCHFCVRLKLKPAQPLIGYAHQPSAIIPKLQPISASNSSPTLPQSKPTSPPNPLVSAAHPSLTGCVFQWKSLRISMKIVSYFNESWFEFQWKSFRFSMKVSVHASAIAPTKLCFCEATCA